ncbi:MAG: class I SAM-dependent methyltransferase [Planctomycetota bacterium]
MADPHEDVVAFNAEAWDKVATAGDRFYRAITSEQIKAARDGNWRIRITPTKAVPRNWLEPLAGKHVLLLAGGGGQQSPILAALGAEVTVFDLSQKQLERDIEIAKREGFEIKTATGDMADLTCFEDEQFDLVLNPCSVCYSPSVIPVWQEVFRVLKRGSTFLTGFINPLYYIFDAGRMDRGIFDVRHAIPYSDADLGTSENEILGDDRPREFGHSLMSLIGAQMESGFQMIGFYEDGWGGGDKLSKHINTFMATRCLKP